MNGFVDSPTRGQLLEAISTDPARLIGETESQWLDFKTEPHLKPNKKTEDKHRFELAKDVTAMANAGGGVIVYGIDEVADAAQPARRVGDLTPIAPGIVDPDQVYKTLREWVYPPTSLRVEIRERAVDGGSIWVLDIDSRPPEELPFLVVREWPPGRDDKGPTRGHFTMYRRQGTSNFHVSPEEVYRWLHAGYHRGRMPADIPDYQRTIVGSVAARSPDLQSSGTVTPANADEALQEELDALEVKESSAYYFLQFILDGSWRLERFFGQTADALQHVLDRFPTLRDNGGFSPFSPYASVERTSSNALRLGLPEKGGVSVSSNGLTTVVCCQHTLTWASEKHAPQGSLLINPVALPEVTAEAARFFLSEVLPRTGRTAPQYHWRIGMGGLGEPIEVYLPRDRLGDIPLRMYWDTHLMPNTAKDFVTEFASTAEQEPEILAFLILKELFYRFGYDETAIPFRAIGGDRLDLDAIRKL